MKNKTTFLITFLFAILCLPIANAQIKLPQIPETQFLITKYGATAASLDNSAAINATIAAANTAGGGTVVIPANTFLSGPITMQSNVRLYLSAGAILQMMPYGEGNGLPAGSYPNNGKINSYDNFIYGENLSNIEVSGTGTVEGNGTAWWEAFRAKAVGKRPAMIRFKACQTVLVKDVTLQNSPGVHLTYGQKGDSMGSDGTISHVTIKAPSTSPNTDAVDTWYWKGVDILNCNFSVGDDNVAMDAGSQNITIKDCTFGTGHGVSVGSFTTDVMNVTVDNCTFTDTTNGLRLKSGIDRGGNESTFSYSNITMTGVKYPFYITCWYPKEPKEDPSTLTAGAVTATTPTWKNISFKNIKVTNSIYAGIIYGLPESYVNNVVFDNVKIEATKKGMVTNFVNGLVFKNSSITIPSDKGNAILDFAAEISGINKVSGQ
jgi:polygalacturonase